VGPFLFFALVHGSRPVAISKSCIPKSARWNEPAGRSNFFDDAILASQSGYGTPGGDWNTDGLGCQAPAQANSAKLFCKRDCRMKFFPEPNWSRFSLVSRGISERKESIEVGEDSTGCGRHVLKRSDDK
jgi:hypothetical protein